jgi:sugar phosphate isomerase/epimerase
MSTPTPDPARGLSRRAFLGTCATGLAAAAAGAQPAGETPARRPEPTRFQVACMTLPYAAFPLQRALTGIRGAGYRFVAWGTSHQEEGRRVPVMAADAPPERARDLGARCRDMGLEPVLMFSEIYPEANNALEVFRSRIRQAAAARIPQVLTFGHTRGANERLWVERFRELAPLARDNNVLIVIKQHGGETGTGAACARIVREINQDSIKVNYDAGNVMDYLRLSPERVLADFRTCVAEVRSFCIKDHRDFPPPHQDCGPGLGEIDHYRLLQPVAFTGRAMPLCCENIFAPRLPRPAAPEGVDTLARRAREFLELVIAGVQARPGA